MDGIIADARRQRRGTNTVSRCDHASHAGRARRRPARAAMAAWLMAAHVLVLGGGPLGAQDLVLENARILDPISRTETRGALWIEGGKVVGVGRAAPSGARGARVDLGGRFVVPGFVDLHTHSWGNTGPGGAVDGPGSEAVLTRVVRAGVTALLDLFGSEDQLFQLRDRQRAGLVPGAALFAAGPCFTATGGHCSEYGIPTRLIDTPDDARRELAALLPRRPDVIKVVYDHADRGAATMPSIDRPTLEALLAGARASSVRTVVHVGTWEDVRHAVEAGADAVTHVPSESVVPAEIIRLMVTRGTSHIPTLTAHTDFAKYLDQPELLDDSLLRALVPDHVRLAYHADLVARDPRMQRWVVIQRAQRATMFESVRRLQRAGVRMLTGTDAANPGAFQGVSVHREMALLAEAGASPWAALAASTTSAGEFLGRRFGVRPGDDGSLVILDKSPIRSIDNTRSIEMVVLRGAIVFAADSSRPAPDTGSEAKRTVRFPAADGGEVVADAYGAGPRGLILAHGGQYDRASWAPQARALARAGLHVVVPDLRGAVEARATGDFRCLYDESCLARDIAAAATYLRRHGAITIAAVGASLGGAAVARASRDAPGLFDGLVLLAPMAVERPELIDAPLLVAVARDDRDGSGALRLEMLQSQFGRRDGAISWLELRGSAHAQALFVTPDGAELLRRIVSFLTDRGPRGDRE